MTLNELINVLADFIEIAVMILLAYVVYRIALLIETLNNKIKGEKAQ